MSDDLEAIPVAALETLAGAWEDSAAHLNESAARAAERGALPEQTEAMEARAGVLSDCARMLREAMSGQR